MQVTQFAGVVLENAPPSCNPLARHGGLLQIPPAACRRFVAPSCYAQSSGRASLILRFDQPRPMSSPCHRDLLGALIWEVTP